jgi:hypothetical protein
MYAALYTFACGFLISLPFIPHFERLALWRFCGLLIATGGSLVAIRQ